MSYQQPDNQIQYQYPQQVPVQVQNTQTPEEFKGGFHPLYIWSIASLVLTYGYIVLYVLISNFLRDTYRAEGLSNIQTVLLFFPFIITVANIVIAIVMRRRIDRRYFLGASLILKYGLIPYFVAGGLIITILFLLIFTPVVIMIFVSPPIILVLSIIGWFSMSESAPFMVVYFVNAAKDGARSGKKLKKTGSILYCVFGCIMQMFFCLDVAAAVVACFKERRHVKLTIVILALPFVLFTIGIVALIISGVIKGGAAG